MQYTIVGLGEILWDMLPSGKALGGAPANFAYHSQEFGGSFIAVVSCVGNDEFGREIISCLENMDMTYEFISVEKTHPTGEVSVSVNKEGKPLYRIQEEVAWDHIPEKPLLRELAFRSDAVCFGTVAQRSPVSRMTIQKFVGLMRHDSLRVFDVNLRQQFYSREVIETSLGLANVLKLNVNELLVLKELLGLRGDERTMLNELSRRYSLRLIAMTRGGEGSILYSGGIISMHDGYRVEVGDTVGAGDAFVAALVTGLLSGCELKDLHNKANQIASFVCSQHGATPRLTDEIKQLFT